MSFIKSVKQFFSQKDESFGVITSINFIDKIDYKVSMITDFGEEEFFLLEDRDENLKVGMKIFVEYFYNSESSIQKNILKWKQCDKKTKASFFLKFLGSSFLIYVFYKLLTASVKLFILFTYLWIYQGFSDYKGILMLVFSLLLTSFMFFVCLEQIKNLRNSGCRFYESLKKIASYKIADSEEITLFYNKRKIIKYLGFVILFGFFVFLMIPQGKISKGKPVSTKENTAITKPTTI